MGRWLWLLPLVLLQACAGTPLAERLERSFATPDEPVQPLATSPRPSQPATTPVSTEPPRAEPMAEPEPEPEPEPSAQVQAAPARPRQPLAPYRITIRLAGADPSAPAEAVTQALRTSAVEFMVERIERVVP